MEAGAAAEAVVAHGADLGIALDGDADRVVIVDERGRIVDGDQLMAVIGESWHRKGRLAAGGVVAPPYLLLCNSPTRRRVPA